MSEGPKIDPRLQFQIEKMEQQAREGMRFEAAPIGNFFRLRFFNDVESVMLLGNREQLRQIHREIGNALDLGSSRKKRQRRERHPTPRR